MTLQGHSTMGLNKPNYTVRFYDDAAGNEKHKIVFEGWRREHKYILKADYYDVTQSRNLIGAEIWREILKTRDVLNPRIAALPTLGAVDGFPVSVWLNGEFLGLYTMCLHKDDDLFDMKDGEQAALLICNEFTEDEAGFRAPAELDEEGVHNWELEFCGTQDWTWVRESFNDLIAFVGSSTDEEFRQDLEKYLDVDSAIDYLILIYTLGLDSSGTKDLVMLNFGDEWIPSAYDMDEAFGMQHLSFDAEETCVEFLPELENGVWTSDTGSLLWDRLLQCFEPEIRERYAELRNTVLSAKNLLSLTELITGKIPAPLYLRDADHYPGRPDSSRMIRQIKTYIPERLAALDSILGGQEK